MADEKTTTPKAEEKTAPKAAKSDELDLSDAGASGDPNVHQALAEYDIAVRNRDALDVPEEDKKAAEDAVKAAEDKLKDLGVAK